MKKSIILMMLLALVGLFGSCKTQIPQEPEYVDVQSIFENIETPDLTPGTPVATGTEKKYHTIDEAPWGTPPWEMGWKLKFEGVEFLCPLDDFVDSLCTRGYELRSRENRYAILSGNYAGKYPQSAVIVYRKGQDAYLAEIYPKAVMTWEEASALYEKIKSEEIQNGDDKLASYSDENLNINHIPEGKNYLKNIHRQFKNDNAVYITYITVPGQGLITIEIIPYVMNPLGRLAWKHGKYQIRLTFRNNIEAESLN